MNLPNKITLFRLFLVPIIIGLIIAGYYLPLNSHYSINNGSYHLPILYLVAGILFVIGTISDWVDGYIARKYHQVTNFGKFFDPIADKLLVNSVLILFAWTQMIPVWVVLILVLRDIWIDFTRILLAKSNVTLAANIWGKLKTALEMIGLTIIFFASYRYFDQYRSYEYGWYNQVIQIPMYLALIISVWSGYRYFCEATPTLFKGLNRGK